MTTLRELWAGELTLEHAFWTYAVIYGLAVNLATSLGFLALISIDRPIAAIVVGYGLSIPYNVLAVVGVWRSAARQGPSPRGDLYKTVTLIGLLILTLT